MNTTLLVVEKSLDQCFTVIHSLDQCCTAFQMFWNCKTFHSPDNVANTTHKRHRTGEVLYRSCNNKCLSHFYERNILLLNKKSLINLRKCQSSFSLVGSKEIILAVCMKTTAKLPCIRKGFHGRDLMVVVGFSGSLAVF